MQAIQRNKSVNRNHAGRAAQLVMSGESRPSRLSKRIKDEADDCSAYDKISKHMDDVVEGGSPQRFKRPKMQSDIIAR
ncbi:hypothetical protein [Herbaspirillum sp. YR522]|uniref:hypothetical protein n=1 Tax=Herbaspirillum sp. YR522 TaxID=1144342 RepID=UPI00026F4A71|nr:hypothetical protein [Herbaspirillum sp. YR522]EJN08471.1 hypothetical protein PMI40_01224 [Herbaspirillum sp. YR522]